MKKSLVKNSFKEISKTKRRFLSILIMAFLGVGFYAGLVACSPDMQDSLDKYVDNNSMYDINIISNPTLQLLMKFNPMYQFINFARTIILYHNCPTLGQFLGCSISSIVVFIIGCILFKKKQDKFIYYV